MHTSPTFCEPGKIGGWLGGGGEGGGEGGGGEGGGGEGGGGLGGGGDGGGDGGGGEGGGEGGGTEGGGALGGLCFTCQTKYGRVSEQCARVCVCVYVRKAGFELLRRTWSWMLGYHV